jgi:parallel beta-helix repeat protein
VELKPPTRAKPSLVVKTAFSGYPMGKTLLTLLALLTFLVQAERSIEAATVRVPEDYKSIQGAINTASAGDTVMVGDGLYTENLVIDKPLTLRSKGGARSTTVEASKRNLPAVKATGAGGISIEGFTMTGSDDSGLTLDHVEGAVIRNNIMTGNFNGISILYANRSTIEGNIAEENTQYGVYLKNSVSNRLEDNTVRSNKDKGIYITFSDGNVLVKNRSYLNRWDGLLLWSSNNNVIRDNKVLRNTYAIIISDSEGNTVEGNSTWPNIILILPALLIYAGIILYVLERYILGKLLVR